MHQILTARETEIGPALTVRRALPNKNLKTIGPWCFLDHFGPARAPVRVGPHPHIGLQTVTWLMDGEIVHRDSLGTELSINPGQLNLMTAGQGIAHSEESPASFDGITHGVQLWIALPDAQRFCEPAFEHYPELPRLEKDGMDITLLMGTEIGENSPAQTRSPASALDIVLRDTGARTLALTPGFEYGLIVTEGEVSLDGVLLRPGSLLVPASPLAGFRIENTAPARLFIVGGAPLNEKIILWWNFVARRHEEIEDARQRWENGGFPPVTGSALQRLTAPPLDYHLGSAG